MHLRNELRFAAALVCGALMLPGPAAAAQAEGQTPGAVRSLLACRAIADSAARLACFDKEAAAMATAVAQKDLLVIDREGVRNTKRTLFGLSVPRLRILEGGGKADEISQIDGVLSSVGRNADGGFVFSLQDGASWTQIDQNPFAIEPRAGDKVVVKRGMLGSYVLTVNRQPGVKVKRIR
jgi:hypothetical protein